MNPIWMIPFIILGGALQTCGAAMNGQLFKHLINPWLASAVLAGSAWIPTRSLHGGPSRVR